jgi:hypothetical protein
MTIYTKATWKRMLEVMLEQGVEQCYENLPSCTEGHEHNWEIQPEVTLNWSDPIAHGTITVPWAIQCSHCKHACILQADWAK